MIGKPRRQLTMVDSAFTNRQQLIRSEKLLERINELVTWGQLTAIVEKTYKKSRRGRPSIPIEYMLKCLLLQYMYNLSDPQLEDALLYRISFQRFLRVSF